MTESTQPGAMDLKPTDVDETCLSLRDRKKLQARQAIHEAAISFVEERGFDAVTVQEICDAAGVSERTFFNYFPSKAMAAFGLREAEIPNHLRERFLSGDESLINALTRLAIQAVDVPRDRDRVKALVKTHPELAPALWQGMGRLRQMLVSVVVARVGDEDEARLAIALVMTALGEVVHEGVAPTLSGQLTQVRRIIAQLGDLATSASATRH